MNANSEEKSSLSDLRTRSLRFFYRDLSKLEKLGKAIYS